MQLHEASHSESINRSGSEQPRNLVVSGWTYSSVLALLSSLLVVFIVTTIVFYFAWDYMPSKIRHLPRYLEAQLLPERPHDEFVAAPVVAVKPEESLKSLQLDPVATEELVMPTAAPVEAADGKSDPTAQQQVAPVEGTDVEGAPTQQEPMTPVEENEPVPAVAVPTAVPIYQSPQPTAILEGLRHEYQGWNNCGPATLAMNLSYFGRSETQEQTAPFLKPDEDDKNVSPHEMASYARSIGLGAKVIVGANLELLRTFVTNGLPVIVESWYIPEPDDQMGHYLLLRGYDGDTLHFYDSYSGPNVQKSAATFDELWKVFNRTAVLVWSPEQEELVTAILGELADPKTMYANAFATAHNEVNNNPHDKFAWFNLGTNLVALGEVEQAVQAFDTARSLQLPWRMLWYQFGPYEAYFASGDYQEVVNLATTTLNSAGNLEESFFWRGRAYEALGQVDAARRDFEQAVRLNPNFAPAHEALSKLF